MIERTFIQQAYKKLQLENYLRKELKKAGFTKAEIMKTPLVTRIVINVTRPGLAIGKAGQNIRRLTEDIEKKFGIDNPQLEIKEITVPELNAQAMADHLSALIERGYSWRSVVYRAARGIQAAGAQGSEILLCGALGGKGGRKRKQRIAVGYMKKVGDQAKLVDSAKSPAYAKFGAIGIKIKIVRPETIFPDKVVGEKMLKAEEKEEEEKPEDAKETVEKKEVKEEKPAVKKRAEKTETKKAVKKETKAEVKKEVKEKKPDAKKAKKAGEQEKPKPVKKETKEKAKEKKGTKKD